jgi:sugar lactone lactonase YvrE
MLLSSSAHDAVERLRPDGTVRTVVEVDAPGQLLHFGRDRVLFTTGDSAASGALSRADGTLRVLDAGTGKSSVYARGLTMPNGMALSPDGRAFTTRDIGTGTGVTEVVAGRPHDVHANWAHLDDTNGAAIDAKRDVLYVVRTFVPKAPIFAIPLRHPDRLRQVGDLSRIGSPVFKGLDGMTIDDNGVLYVAANSGGEVFSFDPRTKRGCLIASGLITPSSVAFGTGHGWPKGSLFVCGFDGTVHRLDPPT